MNEGKTLVDILPLIHLNGETNISQMNNDLFPLMDSECMEYMYEQCTSLPEYILVYPYIRKQVNGKPYFDIYFFATVDRDLADYYRIVIEPGKRLPSEQEEALLWFCRRPFLAVSDYDFYLFNDLVNAKCPELHYPEYESEKIGEAIEYLYFASHKNLLEILYKASLDVIAKNIINISGINYIGTTPSDIIAGIPIRLLKIFNNENMVGNLFEDNSQNETVEIYRKLGGYLKKNDSPNAVQWKYLEKVFYGDMPFIRKVYVELILAHREKYIDDYNEYLKLKDQVSDYYPYSGIPKINEISRVRSSMENIIDMIADEDEINIKLALITNKLSYQYSDDKYEVIVPRTLKEFTREAASQHNCLLDYIDSVLNGTTTIIFVRDKSKIHKSLVTIEIFENRISQALGACNRELKLDELDFVDRFSFLNDIEIEPGELVNECLFEQEAYCSFYDKHLMRLHANDINY